MSVDRAHLTWTVPNHCPWCEETFSTAQGLRSHIVNDHRDNMIVDAQIRHGIVGTTIVGIEVGNNPISEHQDNTRDEGRIIRRSRPFYVNISGGAGDYPEPIFMSGQTDLEHLQGGRSRWAERSLPQNWERAMRGVENLGRVQGEPIPAKSEEDFTVRPLAQPGEIELNAMLDSVASDEKAKETKKEKKDDSGK